MKLGWSVLLALACWSCKHEQSFHDAIRLICNPPANANAAYWKANLRNPEAITLFESIGDLAMADRQRAMKGALQKADLGRCPAFEQAAKQPFAFAPAVPAAPGALELDPKATVVTATAREIAIDGKRIVGLTDGAPDPSDVAAAGVPKVQGYLGVVSAEARKAGGTVPPVALVIAPQLTYQRLIELVMNAKAAGFTSYGVVVKVGDQPAVLPITLPASTASTAGTRLVVTVTGDSYLVWSLGGEDGTLQAPKLTAKTPAELASGLVAIAGRHPDAKAIILMAANKESIQRVVEVMAVLRKAPDGRDLFAETWLSVTE